MRVWDMFRIFKNDEEGATLVYVSIMVTILFAMVGVAVDMSRLQLTSTQAQSAADAAALAAATQLDGEPGSITRATNAAMTTPLVTNKEDFSANEGTVTITSIRFLNGLPASDDSPISGGYVTSDDRSAEYVEVTTETLQHRNLFLPVLGIADTSTVTAKAVAGQEAAICRVTPLAICNPNEEFAVGASFNTQNWVGRQILVRNAGANSQWAPGNFGLLDTPDQGQGAPALADMLANKNGANECFSTRLNTRPGQVGSLRSALNTRFGMYENPFFQNDQNNSDYPPATNVIKGYVSGNGNGNGNGNGASCNNFTDPQDGTVQGLPRDETFTNASGSEGRFGNGVWDCPGYWAVNHPNTPLPPAGCSDAAGGMSRYDMYIYEIENNQIPSPTNTGSVENGSPTCGSPDPFTTDTDRRLIQFAVMNCLEHNVRGNMTGVPAEAFVRAFLTEPVGDESSPGNGDWDVYLEVVDVIEPGIANGVLKEYVEIYR